MVIVDAKLPGKSGLDVIQELSYDFPGVKIIAITGSCGEEAQVVRINAEVFGAYRVFSKPLSLAALLREVEELLHQADAKESLIKEEDIPPEGRGLCTERRGAGKAGRESTLPAFFWEGPASVT